MTDKRDYIIRKAQFEDCEKIYQMIYDMAVFEKMEDQVKVTTLQLQKDGFGDNPKYFSYVVECVQSKQLIGYTIYYYVYSTWKGQIGYLEDVYVSDKWRNQGIGAELIKKVMFDVLSNGCVQCRLACLKWNKNAMALYKKLGVTNLTEVEDWSMLRFDLEEMKTMVA